MQKAKLTGGQIVAAIIAGIIGHLLFTGGWLLLIFVLIGSGLTLILGGAVGSIGGAFDLSALNDLLGNAGGVLGGVAIGLAIAALVLVALAVLISAGILKAGKVRRPWATTWSAIGIVFVLNVPLTFVYFAISRGNDGPSLPLVAFLGSAIVGALVWLWMTWGHRGSASAFAGVSASSASSSVQVTAPAAAEPPTDAPVAEAPTKETPPAG